VQVQRVERGLLIATASVGLVFVLWFWLRRRGRRRRRLLEGPSETYVGPSIEASPPAPDGDRDDSASSDPQ